MILWAPVAVVVVFIWLCHSWRLGSQALVLVYWSASDVAIRTSVVSTSRGEVETYADMLFNRPALGSDVLKKDVWQCARLH